MTTKNTKKTVYIAMYSEYGDSADFLPYVLGVFASYDEAHDAVRNDMDNWANTNNITIDDDMAFHLRVCNDEGSVGCQWNIDTCEM